VRSSSVPTDERSAPGAEVTLEDVARAAGVSQSTASRVLNGSVRRVRPDNEQRVRAAAARLGYVVDLRAQATARRQSDTVLVVVDSLRDPVAMQVAAGVHALADTEGYAVSVTASQLADDGTAELVRRLRGQRPRVIFVIAPGGVVIARSVQDELALYRAHGGIAVVIGTDERVGRPGDADAVFARGRRAAARIIDRLR
jgi:LacI family transcriptional regulator